MLHLYQTKCLVFCFTIKADYKKFQSEYIKKTKPAIIQTSKYTRSFKRHYSNLQIDKLHVKDFADSSFLSTKELYSQSGYSVPLFDQQSPILSISQKKSARFCSVLEETLYAFVNLFNNV